MGHLLRELVSTVVAGAVLHCHGFSGSGCVQSDITLVVRTRLPQATEAGSLSVRAGAGAYNAYQLDRPLLTVTAVTNYMSIMLLR